MFKGPLFGVFGDGDDDDVADADYDGDVSYGEDGFGEGGGFLSGPDAGLDGDQEDSLE